MKKVFVKLLMLLFIVGISIVISGGMEMKTKHVVPSPACQKTEISWKSGVFTDFFYRRVEKKDGIKGYQVQRYGRLLRSFEGEEFVPEADWKAYKAHYTTGWHGLTNRMYKGWVID